MYVCSRMTYFVLFFLILSACAENRGRIGGAFGGVEGADSTNTNESTRVYVKREQITEIETLRPRTKTSKDPDCRKFLTENQPITYRLTGMRYTKDRFFLEVAGMRNRIQQSRKKIARLDLNSNFDLIQTLDQNRENPGREPLVADLNENRLILNVKGVQPNFPPEKRFTARFFDSISLRNFRFLNDELTEHCR